MPPSTNDQSATGVVAGFQPNGDQVTESPAVPVNAPVGTPPTVTPLNEVAAVALPNKVLLRVAVPLISTLPSIMIAWTGCVSAPASARTRLNAFNVFMFDFELRTERFLAHAMPEKFLKPQVVIVTYVATKIDAVQASEKTLNL